MNPMIERMSVAIEAAANIQLKERPEPNGSVTISIKCDWDAMALAAFMVMDDAMQKIADANPEIQAAADQLPRRLQRVVLK